MRAGHYSEDFRAQFELFYEELKEFFNATGLEKRLQLLAQQVPLVRDDINSFLGKKARGEAGVQDITALRTKVT